MPLGNQDRHSDLSVLNQELPTCTWVQPFKTASEYCSESQTCGKTSRTQNGACSVGSAPFINSSPPADISFSHRQPVEPGALPSQFTFSFPPCQARITRRLEQLSGLQVFGKMSLGLLLPHEYPVWAGAHTSSQECQEGRAGSCSSAHVLPNSFRSFPSLGFFIACLKFHPCGILSASHCYTCFIHSFIHSVTESFLILRTLVALHHSCPHSLRGKNPLIFKA